MSSDLVVKYGVLVLPSVQAHSQYPLFHHSKYLEAVIHFYELLPGLALFQKNQCWEESTRVGNLASLIISELFNSYTKSLDFLSLNLQRRLNLNIELLEFWRTLLQSLKSGISAH